MPRRLSTSELCVDVGGGGWGRGGLHTSQSEGLLVEFLQHTRQSPGASIVSLSFLSPGSLSPG